MQYSYLLMSLAEARSTASEEEEICNGTCSVLHNNLYLFFIDGNIRIIYIQTVPLGAAFLVIGITYVIYVETETYKC